MKYAAIQQSMLSNGSANKHVEIALQQGKGVFGAVRAEL
jgi:hypothetical protein